MHVSGISTPALILDVNILKANAEKMRQLLEGTRLQLRPHYKSHKCAALAAWQVRCGANGKPEGVPRHAGFPRNALGWPVTPECMRWGLRFLYERYGLPLYVTENGTACTDVVALDGCVHDPDRIDFTHRYLKEVKRAIEDGVDVRGYFFWSLMDNFEWALGYSARFGMVYVDYPTQTRIIKDSGHWYRSVIECNGENI
jgi:beta-glucosidase